jgi:hypothetical protein
MIYRRIKSKNVVFWGVFFVLLLLQVVVVVIVVVVVVVVLVVVVEVVVVVFCLTLCIIEMVYREKNHVLTANY